MTNNHNNRKPAMNRKFLKPGTSLHCFGHQAGFSLLELLVVLTISGFIVAVAAPRFAGLAGQGLETVTQKNMSDLVNYITADLQNNGAYPAGMINIVSVDGNTGDYHKPMVSDQDPDNEPEVLGYPMDRRHRFFIHYLNEDEAAELKSLGVVYVYNYNSPFDRDVAVGSPHMQPVAAGVAVLMTGGGDSDNSGAIDPDEISLEEPDRAHPDKLFRMVFGLGPETSLVKKGLVHNASTCPESGLVPINHVWQGYSLLLPRLAATERRLKTDDPLENQGVLTAYGVTGTRDPAQLTGALRRTVDAYARQDPAFFEVMDSEGATHPRGEMTGWGLDFDGDGEIG